tara:strand:+ start:25145 stop:25741 length:597 start_codon:yes stop_codon:yes gene_type:complete
MKIFEITEVSKYATPGDGATGDERLKRVQQMARAGVDTTTATKDLGRAGYSGIDPEDLQAKKIRKGASDELKRDKAARDAKEKEAEREEQRKEREAKLADRRQQNKDVKDRTRAIRRGEREVEFGKRSDDRSGFRKDALGRTLRAPRYYQKKADANKGPNRSAIRKGLDALTVDPGYAIADFYTDRVKRIKDFLHQEY